jgi:heme oxygenase
MSTWMLTRLERATRAQSRAACTLRLPFLDGPFTRASYIDGLVRIYGFEKPIEAAFAMTAGLAGSVDLRSRGHIRLLRADLARLGIDTASIEVCRSIPSFGSCCEALGWMYMVDNSAPLLGAAQRHVAKVLPDERASSYFTNGALSVRPRLEDLASALECVAQTPEMADEIIAGAVGAFARHQAWFETIVRPTEYAAPERVA